MQNAKMSEYSENSYKSYIGGLNKHFDEEDEERGYRHIRGVVEHRLGYVAFSQYKEWPTDHRHPSSRHWKSLGLSIVHKGERYTRQWQAWYGEKTIAQLANEFIEDIKGQEGG